MYIAILHIEPYHDLNHILAYIKAITGVKLKSCCILVQSKDGHYRDHSPKNSDNMVVSKGTQKGGAMKRVPSLDFYLCMYKSSSPERSPEEATYCETCWHQWALFLNFFTDIMLSLL